MRRIALLVSMASALGTASLSAQLPGERPYTILDAKAAQLQSAFNAEVGKVRVVMLVSPS
jgi:hypothetical protein